MQEEEEGEKMEDEGSDADEWMVPHGYLSDGEGVDDDDEVQGYIYDPFKCCNNWVLI